MKTITTNTQDLTGRALDWAVGVSLYDVVYHENDRWRFLNSEGEHVGSVWVNQKRTFTVAFEPTTNWGQLGPLIVGYHVSIDFICDGRWDACISGKCFEGFCPTPLIAACRAIVAARIGDTVDVPEVLL